MDLESRHVMLSRDFSIPVMTTEREVKGLVSWRSIGSRLAMGNGLKRIRDAMEQAHEVEQMYQFLKLSL